MVTMVMRCVPGVAESMRSLGTEMSYRCWRAG